MLFAIVFFAFTVGMLAIAGLGFSTGDPAVLIYGTDYTGNLCTEDYPARYFPNPYEMAFFIESQTNPLVTYEFTDVKSICLKDCPANDAPNALNWVCNYPDDGDDTFASVPSLTRAEWAAQNYDYYSSLSAADKATSLAYKGPCYPVLIATVNNYQTCSYLGEVDADANTALQTEAASQGVTHAEAYVLGDVVDALSQGVSDQLSAPVAIMERYIDDFSQGWVVLLVMGFIAPVLLSFVWLGVLRYLTGIFAYLIILGVNFGCIMTTLWLYMKAGVIGSDEISAYAGDGAAETASNYVDPSEENQETLKYCAYAATVVTVFMLIFSLLMLRRVAVAVGVIKVATQAISKAPSVIFFPIFPVFAALGFGAFWLASAVYIYATGDIEARTDCTMEATKPPQLYCADAADAVNCHCGYETKMDENLQYMLLYHLFGLLWTTQFMQAVAYLTLAHVFATYYFLEGQYPGGIAGFFASPAIKSFRKMITHWGSAAVGSFLVALMQFIRIMVAYAVNQLKKAGKDSILIKYAACCVQYCLWYLQKIIEWINRNTYIMIAIEGNSFCWSAFQALRLIFNNIATVGVVNIVGDVLLFLGKLSVATCSGFLAFLMLDSDEYATGDSKVSSPLLIVIFCVVFGFLIAGLFMSVVEMAIDTTLLAFCKDCELHGGKPKFAPPLLAEVLGSAKSKEAENKA